MKLSIEFHVIQCSCGLSYALPLDWIKERRKDHKIFYCPACKEGQYYPNESNRERLERLLGQERNCCISAREDANYFEKKAQGYKGYATRLKKALKETAS